MVGSIPSSAERFARHKRYKEVTLDVIDKALSRHGVVKAGGDSPLRYQNVVELNLDSLPGDARIKV
jgi:hypothetical protein